MLKLMTLHIGPPLRGRHTQMPSPMLLRSDGLFGSAGVSPANPTVLCSDDLGFNITGGRRTGRSTWDRSGRPSRYVPSGRHTPLRIHVGDRLSPVFRVYLTRAASRRPYNSHWTASKTNRSFLPSLFLLFVLCASVRDFFAFAFVLNK